MKKSMPSWKNSVYRLNRLKKIDNMAKESMKAREVKRAKLVAKYAEKRACLLYTSSLAVQFLSLRISVSLP